MTACPSESAALAYRRAGLCVLPANVEEKRPALKRWKCYQQQLPTEDELRGWFTPDTPMCLIAGAVSGNLEIIDFDAGGELFDRWAQLVGAEAPGLVERLVIERSQSNGRHVIYRCPAPICGSIKLAQRAIVVPDSRPVTIAGKQYKPRKVGDRYVIVLTLIETRGEGGLFLCHPSPGYELMQGQLEAVPVLTEQEREILLAAAWSLNELIPEPIEATAAGQETLVGDRPGDGFNRRGDVREVLKRHGWSLARGGDNEHWRRPGKESGWSATLKDRVFYVFSTNAAPFEHNRAYSPFSVYTLLEHGGEYEQAARALRQLGYGGAGAPDISTGVDISGIVRMSAAPGVCSPDNSNNGKLSAENSHKATGPSDNGDCGRSLAGDSDKGPPIQRLKGLIDNFAGLNTPVIHGLLREGETMNIIASPKMGKSWFVSTLAISIASGLDWLGLAVEQGRVLHIDNELHACTIAYRYGVLSEAIGLPQHLYSNNIDMVSLRGQLRDLYSMGSLFRQVAPGQYKLVIIDAFYRTLPRDTDENDNGAIANLYNMIDRYAAQLECAFVLIHHSSKGNQSGKAVTDVGAGAGSQSRAADTHLILRLHEEEGVFVLESAVRSWPPMAPRALVWNWPLFTPTDEVDTSALLGAAKPKTKPRDIPLEDFIDQCVAINDPCSKRSVRYEAGQRFGLSERKGDEMLELAMERGLVSRIRTGASMRYVKNRPGVSGDKALWTAALLAHDPDVNAQEIAEAVGATRQYVNQVRRSIAGN